VAAPSLAFTDLCTCACACASPCAFPCPCPCACLCLYPCLRLCLSVGSCVRTFSVRDSCRACCFAPWTPRRVLEAT
jgi:hypothetical protein